MVNFSIFALEKNDNKQALVLFDLLFSLIFSNCIKNI